MLWSQSLNTHNNICLRLWFDGGNLFHKERACHGCLRGLQHISCIITLQRPGGPHVAVKTNMPCHSATEAQLRA